MAGKSLKTLGEETNGTLATCAAHIAEHAPDLLKNGEWLAQFGASTLLHWRVLTPLPKTDGAVDNRLSYWRATAKMLAPCLI